MQLHSAPKLNCALTLIGLVKTWFGPNDELGSEVDSLQWWYSSHPTETRLVHPIAPT